MYDTLNLKNYGRKEITKWVETECKYKFEELRNGVFFCKIISTFFRESLKYNPEPKNEHQFTINLNLAKKALHKRNLSLIFDVQQLLTSKNHFAIANWFRNLVDGNIKEGAIAVDAIQEGKVKEPNQVRTSFSGGPVVALRPPRPTIQVPPHEAIPHLYPFSPRAVKTNSNFLDVKIGTPKRTSFDNAQLLRKTLSMSRERDDRMKNSFKSNPKSRLELIKRESATKSPALARKKSRVLIPSLTAFTDGEQDVQVLMQQMAVEEVIMGLENILQRVKEAVSSADQHETLQLYSHAIHAAIFNREVPYI